MINFQFSIFNFQLPRGRSQSGQALIAVMLISIIALVAVVSATTLLITELKKNTATTRGASQYQLSFGALENAFLRLLRDPNYSGETLILGSSTCSITATGDVTAKTVEIRCTDESYVRKLQATATFSAGVMSVSGITEIP